MEQQDIELEQDPAQWQEQLQAEEEDFQIDEELLEAEQEMQLLEEHSQRLAEQQPADMPEEIKAVKNPVSPYMIFASTWKERHPTEKFNMSTLGQIWKAMSLSEKEPF
jgi:hypothetical protein